MYNRETNAGIYSLQVKFALRLRARYGKIKTGYYKPEKLICDIKSLNITIRNPNKRIGVYYRWIQDLFYYQRKMFSVLDFPYTQFYQGHKNTTIVNAVDEGQQFVIFEEEELNLYNS
ncbi:hypothetical protein FEM48_Zijuj12G0060400 [Ziziphus jujuba var. spinosa]|uniref:Uncharacterized protein n=1 Tax=Ziziphus jujuba var. spinosa TaxID=714518 RepID=A0A978UBL1_ZIZJJ|nr:hypothetical protein FEM48_Zijuj12G0060400 [Ziziphus jujuba var. spinosa]